MTAVWLVRSSDETGDDGAPLWWSNETGWVSIGDAMVWSDEEQKELCAPLGGEWVRFVSEVSAEVQQ